MEWMRLSFRNLGRNKRRTIINLLSIGFAVGFIILFDMVISGEQNDFVVNSVRLGVGDLKIHKRGYDKESLRHPLDRLIKNPEDVITRIKSIPHIKEIGMRVISGGIISTGLKQSPITIFGVNPAEEKKVSMFYESIVDGNYIKSGTYSVIIGKKLTQDMGIRKDGIVYLYARTRAGANNVIDLNVNGIYNTGFSQIDERIIIIPLDIAQSLFDIRGVSEIVINLDRDNFAPEIKDSVKNRLMGMDLEVYDFSHYIPDVMDIMEMQNGVIKIFRAFLLIIALIGIINTMLMNVWERKKEVGTLRAMGYYRGEISRTFLLESVWTGILGSIVGWAVAFSIGLFLQFHGIVIPMNAMQGINLPMTNIIRGEMHLIQFINGAILGIIATICAGLIPAIRAARIKITDALREY